MLSETVDTILKRFGLDENERRVYLWLKEEGWSTVLSLARLSTIKRTTIYRVLDSLIEKGLVEMKVDDKKTWYQAASVGGFQSFISTKEEELNQMKKSLGELGEQLAVVGAGDGNKTSVNFYRGSKGIASIEWKNSGIKDSEMLMFGVVKWVEVVGFEYAEEIRERCKKNNIKIREILNEGMDNLTNETKNDEYLSKNYEDRYISKEIVPIDNELIITQDAIYVYSIHRSEVVGIEIVNPGYVATMRALFEKVWTMAKPKSV